MNEPRTRQQMEPLDIVEDRTLAQKATDGDVPQCPLCGETKNLSKVQGCIVCLACKHKQDCDGW